MSTATSRIEAQIDSLCDQHECLKSLLANGDNVKRSEFLTSIREKFLRYGNLTDRQIAAVKKFFDFEVRRAAEETQRIELAARGVAAPEGQQRVEGEIVSVKLGRYGWGATLKTAAGWRAWLRLPASIVRSQSDVASLRGRQISFTATLTRSENDPLFAFAKRPADAKVS